jgi:hypothetical protein
MCEECEEVSVLHPTYAEKRVRIDSVWRPAGSNRKFIAARSAAPALPTAPVRQDEANLNSTRGRED